MRKIVQLAVTAQSPTQTRDEVRDAETEVRVVALCDDGTTWMLKPDRYEAAWDRMPDIPQDKQDEASPMGDQAKKLAELVKGWWEKAKFLTTGDRGERNVFDDEPAFVSKAKDIIGDWEAQG